MSSTTIRVSNATRDALRAIAAERGQTLSETVSRAVTLLQQEQMSRDLETDLRADESTWLDADVG